MEVTLSLSKDQQSQLERIAARRRWTINTLVQESVERLIEYNEWWCQEVQKGQDDAAAGRTHTHEEVAAEINYLAREIRPSNEG